MKNLKKLFVVLAVLVAMVCAVTTVVIAETTYDGNIQIAINKLGKYDTAEDQVDENGTIVVTKLQAKENAIADATEYIKTVDPETPGYAELIADLEAKRIDLGYEYLAEVDIAIGSEQQTAALKKVYTYSQSLKATAEGYAEFIMAYNEKSFAITEQYLDQLFGSSSSNYYKLIEAMQSVKIITTVPELSYKAPTSALYTGKQADVEAKLSLLDDKDTLQVIMAGLADVYTYLMNTPINPTTDAYNDFLVKYQEAYHLFERKFVAALEATNVASERLAILVSVRDFLTATPISYELVATYNREVTNVYNSYAEVANEALGIKALDELLAPIPVSDFTTIANMLMEADSLEGAAKAEKFVSIFNYVCENELDVSALGYEILIELYTSVREDVVAYLFATVENETYLPAKFEKIRELRAYLELTPVSEAAVAQYNEVYASAVAERSSFVESLKSLAAVVVPESNVKAPNATVSALEYLLADYNDAVGLIDRMEAMARLYRYVVAATLPVDDEAYPAFLAKYQAASEALVGELCAAIENETDADAKSAAIATVKAFLSENPLSKALVDEYNALVDDADKVSTKFHKMDDAIAAYNAAVSISEKYSAFITLYGYSLEKLDVTDAWAIAEFEAAYALASADVQNAMIESFAVLDTDEKLAAITAAHKFLTRAPFSADAVAAFDGACAEIVRAYTDEAGEIASLLSRYTQAEAYLLAFGEAGTLDEKLAAFTTLYNYIYGEGNDKFTAIESEAYARLMAAYENACAEMTAIISSSDYKNAPKDYAIFLNKIYTFLNACPYSNDAVVAYNARLSDFREVDFAALAGEVAVACPTMTYVTNAKLIGELDALVALLLEADSKDGLAAVYTYLMGLDKAYDIGAIGYIDAIVSFNEAKSYVLDEIILKALVDVIASEGVTADSIKEAFLLESTYISTYPMSLEMVQKFNAKRTAILGAYAALVDPLATTFGNNVDRIEKTVSECPIDSSKLSEASKVKYATLCSSVATLKAAADQVKIEAYKIAFDNVISDKPLIPKNNIVDKVNAFVKKNEISTSYNYAEITSFIFESAFSNLVDEIEALEDAEAKASAIAQLKGLIAEHHVTATMVALFNSKFVADGETPVTTPASATTAEGSFEALCGYVDDFYGVYGDIGGKITAFFVVADYLNAYSISSSSLYASTMASIENMKTTLAKLTEERIAYLDSLTPVEEYSLGYVKQTNAKNSLFAMNYDFENHPEHRQLSSMSQGAWYNKTQDPYTGNYYMEYYTGGTKSPYFELTMGENKSSIVFEVDMMSRENITFKNLTASFTDAITGTSTGYSDNRTFRFTDNKFYIYPNTNAAGTDVGEGDGVLVPGIEAVPGEFIHITVIWNCVTNTKQIYVDYELVLECPVKPLQINPDLDVSLYVHNVRWCNNTPEVYGAYDNLRVYNGTNIRIVDKFEKMNELEKFEYYLEKVSDTSESAIGRLRAYVEASTLYGAVSNQVPADQKEAFLAIDYNGIVLPSARAEFMKQFEEKLALLWDMDLNSSTISKARGDFDEFYDFFMANSKYMDQSDEEFLAVRRELSSFKVAVERVESVIALIKALKKLDRATTAASMQAHMVTAMAYYAECAFDQPGNYETAHNDSTVKDFLKAVQFSDIDSYIAYMSARLDAQVKYENSVRIIKCIGFIEKITGVDTTLEFSAYVEALKEAALQNFDKANPYVDVIRDIYETESYDPECEGVEKAIATFLALDEIFYETFRNKQYAVIAEKLDAYVKASSYIEKYGLWMYVKNYIEDNRVDMNSELGRVYSDSIAAYERELVLYREDYAGVVAANTVAFIATIEKMGAYVTYSELKPLYDEALNKYYYNMNIDAPETQAAIAKFLEYERQLEEIELNSRMFIDTVAEFSLSNRTNQIYRVLVSCGQYVDGVDEGVEGVSEALAIYNAKLAAYNAKSDAVNSDIEDATEIVCSVRTGSISATVLAIIKAIFSK